MPPGREHDPWRRIGSRERLVETLPSGREPRADAAPTSIVIKDRACACISGLRVLGSSLDTQRTAGQVRPIFFRGRIRLEFASSGRSLICQGASA